mmetsp:Transcript_14320/g.25167  ORF Transcript_14320/g.25167 Transcript_14320/m.25167 type:complete len:229 (-) Transcript_14320:72-758(-)
MAKQIALLALCAVALVGAVAGFDELAECHKQCRHLDGRGLATDYDAVCEDQRDQFPRPEAFNACKHGAKHGDVLGCEIGCRNAKCNKLNMDNPFIANTMNKVCDKWSTVLPRPEVEFTCLSAFEKQVESGCKYGNAALEKVRSDEARRLDPTAAKAADAAAAAVAAAEAANAAEKAATEAEAVARQLRSEAAAEEATAAVELAEEQAHEAELAASEGEAEAAEAGNDL